MDPAIEEDSLEEDLDRSCSPPIKGVKICFAIPAFMHGMAEVHHIQDDVSQKLRSTRHVENTTVQPEIWKCPGGVQ
jgi:hypothetical protein